MSWTKCTEDQKRLFAKNLVKRRKNYESYKRSKKVPHGCDLLIVGDRPGPKAPQTDDYHHTPFYSKLYSGGFISAEIAKAGIAEDRLLWVNSASWDNIPESHDVLTAKDWTVVIALGNNAATWVRRAGLEPVRFDHPQAHKRFKSKEQYPLIPYLLSILTESQDQSLV